MKRLTEYVIGEDQTVDGAYLDRLTETFEKDAAANSSAALKNAMVSLVESETFQTRNPNPQTAMITYPKPRRRTGRPAASPIFCRRIA